MLCGAISFLAIATVFPGSDLAAEEMEKETGLMSLHQHRTAQYGLEIHLALQWKTGLSL